MGAFTARFRVLRYDLRGHGGSGTRPGPYETADLGGDLLGLLDSLGEERAFLVGVSLGGMVGMWVAAHHPERVAGLVVCCVAPWLGPPEGWHDRAAAVRAGGTSVLAGLLPGRWFTPAFCEAEPATIARVVVMLDEVDPEGYASRCEAIASMDQRGDLGAITAPTLVVAGADDPVVTPVVAVATQAGIPGSALAVLANASHLAALEHPRRFASMVTDHLLGLPVHRGDAGRRAVLGDAHVDRSRGAATRITTAMQDLITRFAWGDVWSRPGLELRARSFVTIAILTALGRHEELELHLRATRRLGVPDSEIIEMLLHSAIYAGVPAANAAFRIADRVLGGANPDQDQAR